MSESERINDLESIVNKLIIELTMAKSELIVLREMVLGVYSENFDQKTSNTIFKNYIEQLEKIQIESLTDLEAIIPSLTHEKLNVSSNILALKHKLNLNG